MTIKTPLKTDDFVNFSLKSSSEQKPNLKNYIDIEKIQYMQTSIIQFNKYLKP
jgi:hypothetical protein